MPVKEEPQQAFNEEPIDSEQLLTQLEKRKELKDEIDELKYGQPARDGQPAVPGYNEANKNVKGMLNSMELDATKVYRCGRFVLTPKAKEEKTVTFTQSASTLWDIEADAE